MYKRQTDGGSNWTLVNTYDTENFNVYELVCEDIPVGAQTDQTKFRFRQVAHGGGDNDVLSIDNLCISGASQRIAGLRSGDTIPEGVTTQTYRVFDGVGNSTSYSFNITIAEPTAVCQNITVQLDANGDASITSSQVDGGSTVGGGCSISLGVSQTAFDCSDVGSNIVTLTVTGGSSDADECTADVTIEDNVAPTALCSDYTIQLDSTGNGSQTLSLIHI